MYATKEKDDADIERLTDEMYKELVASKKENQNNKLIAQITDNSLTLTSKQDTAEKSDYLTLKKRFIDRYGEENLTKYMNRWMNGVNGFLEGQGLFEYSALKDFFEALSFGSKNVIERAIEIGLRKSKNQQ